MRNVTPYSESKTPLSSPPRVRQAMKERDDSDSGGMRRLGELIVGWLMVFILILFVLKSLYLR